MTARSVANGSVLGVAVGVAEAVGVEKRIAIVCGVTDAIRVLVAVLVEVKVGVGVAATTGWEPLLFADAGTDVAVAPASSV